MTARLLTLPARQHPHYIAIITLSLLLRLIVVSLVLFVYPRNWLFSKAPDLGFLATSLSAGHGLSSPFGGATGYSAFVAPGYPLLLAAFFRIFGSYSTAAGAAIIGCQTLFALLTIFVLMRVAQAVVGAPAANLAGVIWAVAPPLIWLPVILWETSLSILLLTGMAATALRGRRKTGDTFWAAAGAYCGIAMLVNPSLTLALCAMLGWTAYQARPVEHGQRWLCVLALFAVFAPWPLRNARVLHTFIPFRSNFGYELWQGNHAGATGLFDAEREPLRNKREYADYAAQGEVAYMRHKTSAARAYILAHPGEFAGRCTSRLLRFWTGAGAQENSRLIEVYATLVSLLGLAGLVRLFRKNCPVAMLFLLPLLLFPLPYYVTHPDFRFRLVLDPLLTILTAHALLDGRRLFTARLRPYVRLRPDLRRLRAEP